jgi:hypothetical protein
MRGLDPRIHQPFAGTFRSGWIAGSTGGKTRFALLPCNNDFLTKRQHFTFFRQPFGQLKTHGQFRVLPQKFSEKSTVLPQ